METYNEMIIVFLSPILIYIANCIVSIFKRKSNDLVDEYNLNRYNFYKTIYIKYYLKNTDSINKSKELSAFFNNLLSSESDDLVFLSPKLIKNLRNNAEKVSKLSDKESKLKFFHDICLSSILYEIKVEYNKCQSALGYKTYKKYFYFANGSLIVSVVSISAILALSDLKNLLSSEIYSLLFLILFSVLFISGIIFIFCGFYLTDY